MPARPRNPNQHVGMYVHNGHDLPSTHPATETTDLHNNGNTAELSHPCTVCHSLCAIIVMHVHTHPETCQVDAQTKN